MMLLSSIRDQWQRLTARERVLVRGGLAAALAVLFIALVVAPAHRARNKRIAILPTLEADAKSMVALASEVAILKGRATAALPPLPARVNGSLRNRLPQGATLALLGNGEVQLTADAVDPSALTQWLVQVTGSERLRVQAATLERHGTGALRAKIVLVSA